MTNKSKSAWYGVAAVVIGTGIFFLAANKGRLFKKSREYIKALLSGQQEAAPAPPATPAPGSPKFEGRTPTAANGHVRDVLASHPPLPDSGTNFTPQGDVHAPKV